MSKIQIEVQPRERTRKLSGMIDEGLVPGVIYDQTGKSDNIQIPANIVEKLLQDLTGTPIVHVTLGKDSYITLLRETQMDLRRNLVNHLSFMALDPKKTADFDVDISFIGESPAVKNSLGILITSVDIIQLRGLPEDIPMSLEADVSELKKVGDRILVADLTIPDSLEFVHEEDKERILATIQPFQKTLEEEREEEKLMKKKEEEAEGIVPEELEEGEEGAEDGKDEATEDGETSEDAEASGESPDSGE